MYHSPHEISDDIAKLSDEYYKLAEEMGHIAERSGVAWLELKNIPIKGAKGDGLRSNAEIDRVWSTTADGKREAYLMWYLKGLEKLLMSKYTQLRIMEGEVRNEH